MAQQGGLENCTFGFWWSLSRETVSKDHYFVTLRKSKLTRGLPIPAHECMSMFMEADSLYLPLCMHISHKHTRPSSRLEAESTAINIHEVIIINVTKVILFLLNRDGFLHLETNQL